MALNSGFMPTIRRTVRSTLTPDAALAYLSDFENATEWDSGTVRCERLSGDGGPGTRYRNISRFAGRDVELIYTTESLTDEQLVIVGENKTTTSRDTITVRPDGAGSVVDYHAEFTFRGLVRLLTPVMGLLLRRLGDKTAETLRGALNKR